MGIGGFTGIAGFGGSVGPIGFGGFSGFGWPTGFGGFPGFGSGGTGGATTGGAGMGTAGRGGAGTSAAGAMATGGVPTSGSGPAPTSLPTPSETCPTIKSGNLTFLGQPVTIWAGTPTPSQSGPVVIYWYATMSSPQEALTGLGQAAIDEITAQGGLVAAPGASNKKGTNTGDFVWYTGDFETTDEVIACAIHQMHIDPRRIYASGFSAGGLQSVQMSYNRSNYLAAVVPYSGGTSPMAGSTPQDPSNVPAAMVVHGASGSDVVVMDFAQASASYEADIKKRGGFSIDCNHGGGHMIPSGIGASTWQFMKDHPFKVAPEPYAGGIPSGFPSYCKLP